MLLFNQHVVSASKVLTVFPWILEVNASKEEKKSLSAFVLDSKTKEDDKIVCEEWASKFAESDKRLLLQSREMAKR